MSCTDGVPSPSSVRLETPVARKLPPIRLDHRQPTLSAVALLLPHGQAVCGMTPSPMQKTVPTGDGQAVVIVKAPMPGISPGHSPTWIMKV